MPAEIMAVKQSPTKPLRGGGSEVNSEGTVWTRAASSQHTVWTLAAAASQRPCSGNRSCSTVWSADEAASGKKASTKRFRLNSKTAASAEAEPASPDCGHENDKEPTPRERYWRRGSSFILDSGIYEWKCPRCPFVSSAGSVDIVHKQKHSHNVCYHKAEVGYRECAQTGLIRAFAAADEVGWKCPLCDFGIEATKLSVVSESVAGAAKKKHRKDCHPTTTIAAWRRLQSLGTQQGSAYRQSQRTMMLNVSIARVEKDFLQSGGHQLQAFMWPVVKWKSKDKPSRLSIRRAWRCRKCLCCFRASREAKAAVPRGPKKM